MWSIPRNSNSEDNSNSILQPEFTETFHLSKFEIKTLASLASNKVLKNATLDCISSPTFVVIALENKLYVFKEDTFELYWEVSFDSNCDFVTLSDDLCLLLVVENPGTVHLLHILSQKSVWSHNFEENGSLCNVQRIFCADSSGYLSFYVYTKEGFLYEFSRVETSILYKALEEEENIDLFSDIHVEKIELASMFTHYIVKSAFETFCHTFPIGLEAETKLPDISISNYYTIEDMVDGEFSSDWEWSSDEKFFEFYDFSAYGKMIKTACTRDGRYIVCLNHKHILYIFCAFTQVNIAEWGDGDIQNFVLKNTSDPDNLSMSNCEIGILRKYNNIHMFEIRKFPSFDLVYKIQLSESVQLVKSKPNQESWYIIEGDAVSNSGHSGSLKIKSVCESRPEARLLSLLKRRKFKEAVRYAEMHNLENEIIFKTKISCMLKDYLDNPTVTFSKDEQDHLWREVENALNKIKDVEFIKSCILSLAPEMDFMKKFLSCINTWLAANINSDGAADLICQLNKNENKLVTFNILPESLRSNLSVKEFLKKDLLQYMISELIGGGLATALIIWQRHKDELLISLTGENIGELLNAVSDDIPSHRLIPFLGEDFLPSVLSKFPEAVDLIADWIISRIHLLELMEKELWPGIGDQLASMFLELIQTLQKKAEKGAISFSTGISLGCIYKKMINADYRTGCLYELSKSLKLLVKLKENFNCKISLTTFQDSKMEVIFAVLDRINIKYIVKAISEFARPFALENDLDLDLCLELYIKNTLQTSHFTWWSWDEAPWEEHLILVLECIHDTARWMNAALLLVSRAAVPWSDKVKSVVEQGLNSNHPSVAEFKQHSKQVGLKEVLLKYDIRNFPMNNDLKLINTLLNYIFKQNKESALEDAKKVLLACNDSLSSRVYFKFLQSYLFQNKIDELIDLLSIIPSDTAIECTYNLLNSITFWLEDSFLVNNNKDHVPHLLSAGIYFLEFLKSKKQQCDPNLLDAFRCMQKLQKEFNMDETLCDVMSKQKTFRIVEDIINAFLDKEVISQQVMQLEKNYASFSLKIFKINRLCDILGLERASIMAILITSCLRRKMYELVIKLCGELICSYPTQSAETLLQVVNHFYKNFQSMKNMSFETIVNTICYLSNLAVTYCQDNSIEDCMHVARLSTYFSVINQITGMQSLLFSTTYVGDVYRKWRFHPVYIDEGFQLDVSLVVEFVHRLLPLFLRNSNNLEQAIGYPTKDIFDALFKPIINHMKERGQGIAAMRTSYLFYHMQMQFLQNEASTLEAYMLVDKYIKETAFLLLQRIIDNRRLDVELSIGLLSLFPTNPSHVLLKLQKWSSKDLRSVMALGEIGSEFCRVIGSTSESSEYDKIYRRSVLLLKQNIKSNRVDIALNSSDSDYNWVVVKEVVLCPKVSLTTVLECCSAFDLVTDHVLVALLNYLLQESEKICTTNSEIPERDIQSMLNQALCVIDNISSEELVLKNLETQLKMIGSYSYEVLLFIHEQILNLSADILTINSGYFERGIPLLNFLRVYERVSPPNEVEFENWISAHPIDSKLPAISSKRLPFWPLYDDKSYKITNPELTSSTLTVWLRITPLLNEQIDPPYSGQEKQQRRMMYNSKSRKYIAKDDLVMIAVKNSMMEFLKKLPSKNFILNPDKTFLHEILDMMLYIDDPKLMVSIASWVANKMPPGANKVWSFMMAVKFAKKFCEQCPKEREAFDIHKKLSSLHERSDIERILHHNNLADDISLSSTHNPVHLIERFVEEFCYSVESSIKVCKTAAEISMVVDANLIDILFKFFYKWLNISNAADNLDETFAFDNLAGNGLNDDDDANILKAINLLLGMSAVSPTICENMKMNLRKMTVTQRSRFMLCMVSVYGYTAVAAAVGMPTSILKESLPLFLCTAQLESLHLLYTSNMIATCNKVELIQRILSNQCNHPKVLLCCVRMCLEYSIWGSHLWDIFLQRFVSISMTESLQDILQTVQGQLVHMWHFKSFISAWNSIICSSFKRESSNEQKIIETVYKTILRCPCAAALDIESLWNDLKYFVQTVNGKNLKEMKPVSDVCSFLQVLKSLQES